MLTDKSSVGKWIVKSENKILGPFSYDQIEDLIRKKQISLIDEVRDSYTRWLYVRENPEFKDIVETTRKELDSKLESTKTFQSVSKSEEMAKTKTDVSAQFKDEASNIQDISVVKEIVQTQKEDRKQFSQDESKKREKVTLYGLQTDTAVQQKVSSSGKNVLIGLVMLLFVGLGSAAAYYYYQKSNQSKQEETWSQQIKKYKFLGLEQKAVEIFGRLPAENQKKMLPQVIELLPLLETNGVIRMSEIETLKTTDGLSIEQRVSLQLVQYWLAMQAQNYDTAQEFIVKAAAIQPSSSLVKENDALVQLKKNQFKKAFDIYYELYKIESSGRYLFGMVLAVKGLTTAERAKFIPEISQLIEKYTFVYYDYKKELLLAQLYFSKLDKNEKLYEATWKQFVDTPCQLSSLFKKPLLLAPNSYQWKDLGEYIKLVQSYLTTEESVLFETHQLIESSQISLASQYNTQNAAKLKDNFMKQQLNMLIFHFQSRTADITALEKTNQLDMKSELTQVILALDKLEDNPNADVSKHLQFFTSNQMSFYHDWISLVQTTKIGNLDAIKAFTRNHFLTVNNFVPALEAKSLVE